MKSRGWRRCCPDRFVVWYACERGASLMSQAHFRFYEHLNYFLAVQRRQVEFVYPFDGVRSVKDMIEAAGVPHTEVSLIRANGQPVDFGYYVHDGDQISVYPASPGSGIVSLLPDEACFVADIHLGRLVAHLRMVGFDTLYPDDYRDEHLAQIAADEKRILLTRDAGLLKRKIVARGLYLQTTDPWKQFAEVLHRFDLFTQALANNPRCAACNGHLRIVDKAMIRDRLPDKTREYFDEFRECVVCGKLYWKGSHFQRITTFLKQADAQERGRT